MEFINSIFDKIGSWLSVFADGGNQLYGLIMLVFAAILWYKGKKTSAILLAIVAVAYGFLGII